MNYATKDQMGLIAKAEALSKDIQVAYELVRSLEDERQKVIGKLCESTNVGDLDAEHANCFDVVTSECLTCRKEFTYASTSTSCCEICPACFENEYGKESHMLLIPGK